MFGDEQPAPVSANPHLSKAERLAEQRAQDAEYYRRVLHNLIDIGNDLAEMVHREAQSQLQTAQPSANGQTIPPAPKPETIKAFDMAARAVRRTIHLAKKIDEPAKPQSASDSANRTAARKRILRDVEDVIQRKTKEGDEAEHLQAELHERLDDPDLDDEIADRPVVDIIQDICRDLGIAHLPGSHPWKRRTPADIARLAARATAPLPPAPRPPSSLPRSRGHPQGHIPQGTYPQRHCRADATPPTPRQHQKHRPAFTPQSLEPNRHTLSPTLLPSPASTTWPPATWRNVMSAQRDVPHLRS